MLSVATVLEFSVLTAHFGAAWKLQIALVQSMQHKQLTDPKRICRHVLLTCTSLELGMQERSFCVSRSILE